MTLLLLQETTIPDWVPSRGEASFLKNWDSRLWGCVVFSREPHEALVSDPGRRVLAVKADIDGIGEVVLASFHAGIVDDRVIPALRIFRGSPAAVPRGVTIHHRGRLEHCSRSRGNVAKPWSCRVFTWIDEELGWHDPPSSAHAREGQTSLWSVGSRPLQADHIFVDALTAELVNDARVVDDDAVRGMSDHGPLVVDFATG